MLRLMTAAVVAAFALVALSGCGDDDKVGGDDFGTTAGEVEVATYVDSMCRAYNGVFDVQLAEEDVRDKADAAAEADGATVEALRRVYVDGLTAAAADAATARQLLERAGYPRMDEGEDVATRVRELADFEPAVVAAREEIRELSATSARALQIDADRVMVDLVKRHGPQVSALAAVSQRDEFVPNSCR